MVLAAVALPNVGALDEVLGITGADAGATKEAVRLLASSSSACFLARACLSLHVNFFGPPTLTLDLRAGAAAAGCCSNAANGFLSLLGAGSETGVYADPTGFSSSSCLLAASTVSGLGADAVRAMGGEDYIEIRREATLALY